MGPLPAPAVALDQRRALRPLPPRPRRRGARARLARHRRRARRLLRHAARVRTTRSRCSSRSATRRSRCASGRLPRRRPAKHCRRKPILLTFDDGRLDSYRGADRILARVRHARRDVRHHRARSRTATRFYLTLGGAARDARLRALGRRAARARRSRKIAGRPTRRAITRRSTRRAASRARAASSRSPTGRRASPRDLFTATRALRGPTASSRRRFAVPYGDYGQRSTNDPRIPRLMSGLLTRQFGNWFIQADDNDPSFTRPGTGAAERYELRHAARVWTPCTAGSAGTRPTSKR